MMHADIVETESDRVQHWPISQYRLRHLLGAIALVAINCGMLGVVRREAPVTWLYVLFSGGLIAIAALLMFLSRHTATRGITLGFIAGSVAMAIAVFLRGYMPILLVVGGPKPFNEIHPFAETVVGAIATATGFALVCGITFGIVRTFLYGYRATSIVAAALLLWWFILWNVAVSGRSVGPMGPDHRSAFPYEKIDR